MIKIKKNEIIFLIAIICLTLVPMLKTDYKGGAVSETEKRMLAEFPKILDSSGNVNLSFRSEFDEWLNDNIGFREEMVGLNNILQYRVFNRFEDNNDLLLGPKGELNYVTDFIMEDWHQLNIPKDSYLEELAESYQFVNDWLLDQGIQFYRMQCWDKQTIYPEQFPRYALKYGDKNRSQVVTEYIGNHTSVFQPDLMRPLIEAKDEHEVYPVWGDVSHWTFRGALIGYTAVMNEINKNNSGKYRKLTEDDFEIGTEDVGNTLLGHIHEEDYVETFVFKDKVNIERDNSLLTLYADDVNCSCWVNYDLEDGDILLVIGDSYTNQFLLPYYIQSFKRVVFIQGNHASELYDIVNEYKPDIVIHEHAERTEAYRYMISAAARIKEMDASK